MSVGIQAQAGTSNGRDVTEPLGELLSLCCDVAQNLEHLDDSLAILERNSTADDPPGPDSAEQSGGQLDAQARATRARDGLTQRLLEALAVLGRTRIAVAAGDPAAGRLTDFTRELNSSVDGYVAARREVETLIG